MAERRRIIEGTWNCSSCDTADIAGSVKACPVCGNPREDDEAKFNFGKIDASGKSSADSVADAAKLELAAAGADWYCASCGSANKGTNQTNCSVCGDGDPASRLAKKPLKPKNTQVNAALAPPEPPPSGAKKGAAMGLAGCLVFGGFGVVGTIILGLIVAAMWTSSAAGQVTAMHWERAIQTETFTPVIGKIGWKSDLKLVPSRMPSNGKGEVIGADNLRACVTGEKSPKKCEKKTKKVECGTEEKCEVKDKGNGFAEEVCVDVAKMCDEAYDDCQAAVIDDKCTYDTWVWKAAGAPVVAKGDDNAPKWPAIGTVGALDRQTKTETYTVSVTADGVASTYNPTTEAGFTKFSVGQSVVVTTNALGSVTNVEPK